MNSELCPKLDDSVFTYEDAKKAATDILRQSNTSFEELKSRPWYKSLLKAITFKRDDKVLALRNIRDTANLQKLFMQLYVTQLENQDSELDEIVNELIDAEDHIGKLYKRCVLGLKEQTDLHDLCIEDQEFLLLLLALSCRDNLDNDMRERLQEYNSAVHTALQVQMPCDLSDFKAFASVRDSETLYRCLLEQCAVIDRFDPLVLSESVRPAFRHLKLSQDDEERIKEEVKRELDTFGVSFFCEKYRKSEPFLDVDDGYVFDEAEADDLPHIEEREVAETADGRSYHDIEHMILEWTSTKELGDPQSHKFTKKGSVNYEAKNKLIGEEMNDKAVVGKTVVEITKLKKGTLVFTTSALYYSLDKKIYTIRYADVNTKNVGVKPIAGGHALVFDGPDGRVEIADAKLNERRLEEFLETVSTSAKYALRDTLVPFESLEEKVRLVHIAIVSAVLLENGYSEHEAFRLATDYGMTGSWSDVKKMRAYSISDLISMWKNSLPYPNEEALSAKLLGDLCRAFQFAKNSEVLTIEEKRYFPALFTGGEDEVDKVVRFAQLEKQIMEGTIDSESAAKVVEGFLAVMGMVGGYALAYWGAVFAPLGLLVPLVGPFAVVGAASAFLSNYLTSKKNKKIEDIELRKKLFAQTISSYLAAKTAAIEMGETDCMNALTEEIEHIAEATGFSLPQHNATEEQKEKIVALITNFLTTEKAYGTVATNLKNSVLQKMLSQLAIQGAHDDPSEIIGVYDASLSNCVTGNFSGILFMKDGFYFRKNSTSPARFMMYADIKSVLTKFSTMIVRHRQGKNMELKGISYSTPKLSMLFTQIINIIEGTE